MIDFCRHVTSCCIILLIWAYEKAEKRVQDVQEDIDNANLEEGQFAAVVLSNYKKRPVIGKVLEFIGDSQFVFKHEEPQ